ncbi:hypothetical protein HJC23_006446 [Cyclotella cryptica]|uniref:Uncharacterized protein n=1 Tax=Cyclotella cryptica TaxID=29204 RepID=A0ABD3QUJ3_9STRA
MDSQQPERTEPDVVAYSTKKIPHKVVEETETRPFFNWDIFTESVYDVADSVKARLTSSSIAADFTPSLLFETLREKAMRQLTSIDVISSSDEDDEDQDDSTKMDEEP